MEDKLSGSKRRRADAVQENSADLKVLEALPELQNYRKDKKGRRGAIFVQEASYMDALADAFMVTSTLPPDAGKQQSTLSTEPSPKLESESGLSGKLQAIQQARRVERAAAGGSGAEGSPPARSAAAATTESKQDSATTSASGRAPAAATVVGEATESAEADGAAAGESAVEEGLHGTHASAAAPTSKESLAKKEALKKRVHKLKKRMQEEKQRKESAEAGGSP